MAHCSFNLRQIHPLKLNSYCLELETCLFFVLEFLNVCGIYPETQSQPSLCDMKPWGTILERSIHLETAALQTF